MSQSVERRTTSAGEMKCSNETWHRRRVHGMPECLDIFAPDGRTWHIHGTWTGWRQDALEVLIELPCHGFATGTKFEPGQIITIEPIVMMWRPYSRTFIYQPRKHYSRVPGWVQKYLDDHPEWDAESVFIPGPRRHQ